VLSRDNPPSIKLCDFGFARSWEDQSNMYTQVSPRQQFPDLALSWGQGWGMREMSFQGKQLISWP